MSRFFKWKNKIKDEGPFLSTQTEKPTLVLHTYPELKKQMDLIGLTEHDLSLIKSFKPFVQEHIEEIVSTFYDKVLAVPHLREIILTT